MTNTDANANIRNGKRTVSTATRCTECGAMTPMGGMVWRLIEMERGPVGSETRCMDCGPNPAHVLPSRKRLTKAEGLVTRPGQRRPGEAAEVESVEAVDLSESALAAIEALRKADGKLGEAIGRVMADVAALRPIVTIRIEGVGREPVEIKGAHKCLSRVLKLATAGIQNIYLVGPAGSGKTTLAKSTAKALGLQHGFLSLSGGVNESHLLGRMLPQADGSWAYQKSLFVRIFEEGGVFLLDEVDAADPNVLVTINAALANGMLSNPVTGTMHERHKDTVILCAANTFGTGADAMFVGRNQLDAATLDRFCCAMVEVDYDRDVETTIAQNACGSSAGQLLQWVWATRDAAQKNRIRRTVGTRLVENSAKLLASGETLAEIKARFFTGWSEDEKRKVGFTAVL